MLRVMGPRGAVPAAGSLWTANGTDHVFWKHFHSGETQVRVPEETGQHLLYKEKKIQFFFWKHSQSRWQSAETQQHLLYKKKNIQFFSENIASLVGSLQRRSSIRYNKCCVAADCKCTCCTLWIVCFWRYLMDCVFLKVHEVHLQALLQRRSTYCTLWQSAETQQQLLYFMDCVFLKFVVPLLTIIFHQKSLTLYQN